MLSFAFAVFLLIITPGPGVLTTAGIGSAFGYKHGLPFVTGLWLGNNLVGLAVVTGLWAIVASVPTLRTVLVVASVGYLLYLAFTIAFSGAKIAFIGKPKPPGFKGALMLQAINPKAYAVNTAFFSGFPIFPEALLSEIVVKFIIMNLIWIPIHLLWLWAGVSVQKLNLEPRTQRTINILMALSMLGVVALAAFRATGN